LALSLFLKIAPSGYRLITSKLIGEPIHLSLEAELPADMKGSWILPDSIPHFEFIEKGGIDSAETAGMKSIRQNLVITSFDSGTVVFPPIALLVNNKKYHSDSILVMVSFRPFDPRKDYHDIKDIIQIENPYIVYVKWAVVGLTLCSILLTIYIARLKIPDIEEPRKTISKLSPFEEAMQALKELKNQNLPESGQIKLFYTQLNDILRWFVLRKLQISSLEKTNEELIMQLRQLRMAPSQFSKLAEALRMSDFVKFAKYLPGHSDNETNYEIIESSVQILNEMDQL
jgi:hypothetical protein